MRGKVSHWCMWPGGRKTKRVKVGAQKNKCRRKGKLVAVIWQRRGLRGGWRKREGKKKVPERLSLLVLAAVAPAVHGGCGAEQPIHPAHQGRTQHRKTGRKRGYSSWMHCLSVWRSARHKQSNTTVRERERAEEEIEGDGHHPVKTVKHIKITKTYGPGPGIVAGPYVNNDYLHFAILFCPPLKT